MSPTGHFAMGFAAKGIEPAIPLWALLLSSYAIDLLYFIFVFLGLDNMAYDPWSHSLLMALAWSFLGGLIAFVCSHRTKTGIIVALTAFSHWVLDFIVWERIPLTFDPTAKGGLGLYGIIGFNLDGAGFNRGTIIATSLEGGMMILSILLFIRTMKKLRKRKGAARPAQGRFSADPSFKTPPHEKGRGLGSRPSPLL